MAEAEALPRVAIVALGGTIASVAADGTGAVPTLDAASLTSGISGLDQAASLELFNFRQLPGAHLQIGDLVELAVFLRDLGRQGFAGAVVTQGTDTIEETAFALDLQLAGALPIVVTGAMRGPSIPGADGAANVLGAVRVAGSRAASGCGVMVVMDDSIHAARWVRKTHSSRPSAFTSPMTGPIGWITEDRVRIAWSPPSRAGLGELTATNATRVCLLPSWLGDDGRLIQAAADAGYSAIVLAATGGGHVNPVVAEAVGMLAKRMPVILASRTGSGEVLRQTYGFTGSESDLLARGAISAGVLDSVKARLLLELLLARATLSMEAAISDFVSFTVTG